MSSLTPQRQISFFFKSCLFWDVDMGCLDIERHARFIIQRVISRGNLTDWEQLLCLYGENKIRDEVINIRSFDQKSLRFLSVFFDIDEVNFRCSS